jgi:hypothetical protein
MDGDVYVRVVPGSLVRWLRIHVDSSSATASSSFIACLASSTHEVVSVYWPEKACTDRRRVGDKGCMSRARVRSVVSAGLV